MSLTKVSYSMINGESVNVLDYGADPTGINDSALAIQLALDKAASENAYLYFPAGQYTCSQTVTICDTTHPRGLKGIYGPATITFTNAGSPSDSLATMQLGFKAVATDGANEVSGWYEGVFEGVTVYGPANGAGLFLGNSGRIIVSNAKFSANRYGLAADCCINVKVVDCALSNSIRAGVGWIWSKRGDVHYASAYFNDTLIVDNCAFFGDAQVNFGIEDHGSNSFCQREVKNSSFTGANNQYVYIGRTNIQLMFTNNWSENVKNGVYFISSGFTSGNIPGTSISVTEFPAGYARGAHIVGNMHTGMTGTVYKVDAHQISCFLHNNYVNTCQYFVTNADTTGMIIDAGNVMMAGTYKSLNGNFYTSIKPVKKSLFVAPHNVSGTGLCPHAMIASGGLTRYDGATIGNATQDGYAYFTFILPNDVNVLESVYAVVMSAQTGNAVFQWQSNAALPGQNQNSNPLVLGTDTVPLVADVMTSYSNATLNYYIIPGAVNGVMLGRIGSNAADTVTDVSVAGLIINYY